MMKSIFLLSFTLITTSVSYAQSSCKEEIMTLMRQMRKAEGAQQAHVKYVINAFDKDVSLSKDTVDIYTSPKRSRIVTLQSEIFQSEKLILSLLNKEKIAYVMDPKGESSSLDQFNNGTLIQDTIITRSEVIECITVCVDEANNMNLNSYVLKVDDAIGAYFGYDKISFFTDPDRKSLKKIELKYQTGMSPSRVVIDMLEYDTSYKDDIFDHRDPLDILARLKAKKNEYEIFDLRKDKSD